MSSYMLLTCLGPVSLPEVTWRVCMGWWR